RWFIGLSNQNRKVKTLTLIYKGRKVIDLHRNRKKGKGLFRKAQAPSQLKNLSLTPTATAVREERK
ncbi:hypothetical protein ABQD95_20980, partial [Enterococcus avium]|uniref:hypothetical protein n=1 Tax=Enterococcus avium TaxID=33945 RepID=UPI0032E4B791